MSYHDPRYCGVCRHLAQGHIADVAGWEIHRGIFNSMPRPTLEVWARRQGAIGDQTLGRTIEKLGTFDCADGSTALFDLAMSLEAELRAELKECDSLEAAFALPAKVGGQKGRP